MILFDSDRVCEILVLRCQAWRVEPLTVLPTCNRSAIGENICLVRLSIQAFALRCVIREV